MIKYFYEKISHNMTILQLTKKIINTITKIFLITIFIILKRVFIVKFFVNFGGKNV